MKNPLRTMLVLETAASDWFARLSPEAQRAYRMAHPGTHQGGAPSSAPARDDHLAHVRHHDELTRFHSGMANRAGEDLDNPTHGGHAHAATLHSMAASRHMRAHNTGSGAEGRAAHAQSREANLRTARVLRGKP